MNTPKSSGPFLDANYVKEITAFPYQSKNVKHYLLHDETGKNVGYARVIEGVSKFEKRNIVVGDIELISQIVSLSLSGQGIVLAPD